MFTFNKGTLRKTTNKGNTMNTLKAAYIVKALNEYKIPYIIKTMGENQGMMPINVEKRGRNWFANGRRIAKNFAIELQLNGLAA